MHKYNVRSLKKLVNSLEVGETFYFNSIAGTISMIDYIRELIQAGKITPDAEELAKFIKAEYHYKFYTGESIAPQMTYRIIAK